MKFYLVICMFFFSTACRAQGWYAEVMAGGSMYNGDLSQNAFSFKRLKPAVSVNFKYNTGDFINFRAGLSYAQLGADDKDNYNAGLRSRNLNFKTNIFEFNVCAEVNIYDPLAYYAYPYIFGGAGIFHFNPFTYDDQGNKTFLQPLGTEGEGTGFNRKKYPLYQVCFPVGGGFKLNLNNYTEVGLEFGYRILLTDYLDDVSKTYVNLKELREANGAKAVELSYRKDAPFMEEGEKRGNSGVRDNYFFFGVKLSTKLGNRDSDY